MDANARELRKSWNALGRGQRGLVIFCLLVSLAALISGMHRAKKGRNALLKWGPVYEAIEAGEPIYEVGEEGYPTLPITLMLMAPFHALGPMGGAFAWALVRIGLAWWLVLTCMRMAAGRARELPWGAQAIVLLLSLRVLFSEIQHANINLWVACCLVLAARNWAQDRQGWGGAWIGIGAAMKVTPALGIVLILRDRSVKGLAGFAAGLGASLCLPALWLGVGRTYDMTIAWGRQMLLPYLEGRELGLRQTEHINQSLLGWLGRFFTDSVAIPAHSGWPTEDVSATWVALSPGGFRLLHGAACLVVLGV
ncbi:MAG: DUF2029 domain-containing protein, partial [Planctomycetes bacterium]|nr:DUF2029 domain-containing protein [Planctomycetota bacterium]